LLYIAAFLKKQGYTVDFIDCLGAKSKTRKFGTGSFHREEVPKPAVVRHIPRKFARYGIPETEFIEELNRIRKPDAILVTSVMTYWYPGPQHVVEIVRQKFPGTPVILGGIYATLMPEHAARVVKPDHIITGPGELKILALLKDLFGAAEGSNFVHENLDSYPYPAFDLLRDHLEYLIIMTARGCPFNCTFCAQKLIAMPFVQRDPDAVVEEMQYHYHKYKLRDFAFYDDALFINRDKHIKIILEKLVRRRMPLRLHSPNGLFAKHIDRELAELMHRTNFRTIRLSFETSNEDRRRDMNNKISNKGMIEAVNALTNAGFRKQDIEAYVIMGLPDQPLSEVLASAVFINDLGLMIRLASFSPIPGTVEFERAVAGGLIPADIDPLLTNKTIFPLQHGKEAFETYRKVRVFAQLLNDAACKNLRLFSDQPFPEIIHALTGETV
jgi:radical SAM superfamily enzyme YgiQ (UPF0313 family)